MHHRFVLIDAQVFGDVRTVYIKIRLDNKRAECLNKNSER